MDDDILFRLFAKKYSTKKVYYTYNITYEERRIVRCLEIFRFILCEIEE